MHLLSFSVKIVIVLVKIMSGADGSIDDSRDHHSSFIEVRSQAASVKKNKQVKYEQVGSINNVAQNADYMEVCANGVLIAFANQNRSEHTFAFYSFERIYMKSKWRRSNQSKSCQSEYTHSTNIHELEETDEEKGIPSPSRFETKTGTPALSPITLKPTKRSPTISKLCGVSLYGEEAKLVESQPKKISEIEVYDGSSISQPMMPLFKPKRHGKKTVAALITQNGLFRAKISSTRQGISAKFVHTGGKVGWAIQLPTKTVVGSSFPALYRFAISIIFMLIFFVIGFATANFLETDNGYMYGGIGAASGLIMSLCFARFCLRHLTCDSTKYNPRLEESVVNPVAGRFIKKICNKDDISLLNACKKLGKKYRWDKMYSLLTTESEALIMIRHSVCHQYSLVCRRNDFDSPWNLIIYKRASN